ncbi:MAG: DUF1992 domain-containing protein [Deltaproteobacteria bacterium]|nr:DUF1992 domain-containing protein [Deltaproteobacteria bacterium]
MSDIFRILAERKIKEAQEKGEFDNLSGKGKPLDFTEWDRVPEELRLAYKILKNAGYSPPEIELKKEITRLEDLLASSSDEQEKLRQIKKLNFLVTKLNMMRPMPVNLEKNQKYFNKIVDQTKVAPKKS